MRDTISFWTDQASLERRNDRAWALFVDLNVKDPRMSVSEATHVTSYPTLLTRSGLDMDDVKPHSFTSHPKIIVRMAETKAYLHQADQ